MFDLGWQEFFLIAVIGLLVVGPKDLPGVIRTVVKWIRKVRGMARDFQHQVEEVAREAELDEIRQEARKLSRTDIAAAIRDTVDPDGEMTRSVDETRQTIEREARRDETPPPAAGSAAGETAGDAGARDEDAAGDAGGDPASRDGAGPAVAEPAAAVDAPDPSGDEPEGRSVAAAAGERR